MHVHIYTDHVIKILSSILLTGTDDPLKVEESQFFHIFYFVNDSVVFKKERKIVW